MAYEYITNGIFTLKSDVWSFAVLVWEILSFARVPYGMLDFDEMLDKLEDGYRLPCPKETKDIKSWSPEKLYGQISTGCFVADPDDRATLSDVVRIIEGHLSQDEIAHYTDAKNEYQIKSQNYLKISNKASVY